MSDSSAAEEAKKAGPTMNPEWGFQTEEVDKKGEDEEGETLEKNGATWFLNGCSEGNRNNNVPVDMDEYGPFLNFTSATSRAAFVKPHDSAARAQVRPRTIGSSSEEDEFVGENRDLRRSLSDLESACRRKEIDLCKLLMKNAQLRVQYAINSQRTAWLDHQLKQIYGGVSPCKSKFNSEEK